MLTTAPHLRIRRPSPTTAEFTVTTLPPQTLPLRLTWLFLLLLRLTLAVAALLVLHARWARETGQLASLSPPLPFPRQWSPQQKLLSVEGLLFVLNVFQRSSSGVALARLAATVPLPALLVVAAVLVYLVGLRFHAEESLLVLRGLGVQTSKSAGTYFASAATRFIPTEKIQDIFVNEAFLGFEVRYYLVVVVEGEDDVVVVFPGLLPRRKIVETVWRGARESLYEKRGDDRSGGWDKS